MALLRECLWAVRQAHGEHVPPLPSPRGQAIARAGAPATALPHIDFGAVADALVRRREPDATERPRAIPR